MAGVGDRVEVRRRGLLHGRAAGADAYLLSRVLHDWDDDDAERILDLPAAMRTGSRLLVVEAVLPEQARDQPAAIRMDLHMLLLLGARERTAEAEFRQLLELCGFEVQRVVPTGSPAGLGVIEATPA